MTTRGLPDLAQRVGPAAFGAYDVPGQVVVVPGGLALATDADGLPLVRLERFRGVDPGRPPGAYGLLSLWLTLTASDPAPDQTGRVPPSRRVVPDRGELRVALDQVGTNAEAVVPPSPMPWDGALTAVWSTRLGIDATDMLTDLLAQGLLPLQATAELEFRGVAPRPAARVRVDWPELVGGLGALGSARGIVARSDVVSWLRVEVLPATAGPVLLLDGDADEAVLGETLADWLRVRAGGPASQLAESVPIPGAWRLQPQPGASDSQVWDLSSPLVTWRPLTVSQDLHGQLGPVGSDLARYRPEGRTVAALDLGWAGIDVLANLPAQQVGVLASGVNLTAPPHPPQRHQAATASLEFTPAHPRGRATLRFAPREDVRYVSQAWTLVEDAAGVREVTGPERPCTGERLVITPDDFGVRFVPVTADDALLALAEVGVTLSEGGTRLGAVTLRRGAPDALFVLDPLRDAAGATSPVFLIRLRSLRDGAVLDLDPAPAEALRLGRPQIPGWGPHEVRIEAGVTSGPLTALDLRPELAAEDDITPIAVTEAQPARLWRYLAADPLHPGYYYRLHPVTGPGPWLGPFPPEHPILLGVPQ